MGWDDRSRNLDTYAKAMNSSNAVDAVHVDIENEARRYSSTDTGSTGSHRRPTITVTENPIPPTWETVRHIHRNGFLSLVTSRRPITQFLTLFDWVGGAQKPPSSDGEFGYRISFAGLHRAYLRHLQAELIDKSVKLQFGSEEAWRGDDGSAAGSLGSTFRAYGKITCTSPLTSLLTHNSTSSPRPRIHGQVREPVQRPLHCVPGTRTRRIPLAGGTDPGRDNTQ